MAKNWTALGAILSALGVISGAFATHFLKSRLEEHSLEVYRTGAQYHLLHAVALTLFGIWLERHPEASGMPGGFFLAGILTFSGSLYLIAITGVKVLGALTPIG